MFGLNIEQLNGAADHFAVDAVIDLREVRRLEADGHIERFELELKAVARLRMHRINGVGALGLQPDVDVLSLSKCFDLGRVFVGERLENAKHERGMAVAVHSHFNLRKTLGDGKTSHQFAHGRKHVGDLLRQDAALGHVGDVA